MNVNVKEDEKNGEANELENNIDIYQSITTPLYEPLEFNKSAVKLFAIIGKIYIDNHRKKYYSVKRFKSYLSLYFGFKSENINLKFNFLESVGIVKVQRRAKKGDAGGLELNIEKLLEYYDTKELFDAYEEEKAKDKKAVEEEAKKFFKDIEAGKNAEV